MTISDTFSNFLNKYVQHLFGHKEHNFFAKSQSNFFMITKNELSDHGFYGKSETQSAKFDPVILLFYAASVNHD